MTKRCSSRITRFDPKTQALHWLLAGLIIYLMVEGAQLAEQDLKDRSETLQLHAGLGLIVLLLAVAAVVRRACRRSLPYPATMSIGEKRAARWVAWILYLMAIVQPVTGIFQAATYSDFDVRAFDLWNLTALLPSSEEVTGIFHTVHALGFFALYLLIALHVAASLKHALVDDDDIPWRMMPLVLARPLERGMKRLYRLMS